MLGKILGARQNEQKAQAKSRKEPAVHLEVLGLAERPFREARHGFLLRNSEASGGALEKLLASCRQGGEVLLASASVSEIQHPLSAMLAPSLGPEFLVVSIQADLLMGAGEVLDRISESLSLATGQACPPRDMIAGFREFLETQDELKALVVQIGDAHELGAEVIDALLELAADPAAGGVLRLLLWGEFYLWESLGYLLAERGLSGRHVEIPPFTREDVSDYLEHCLVDCGYGDDFPFSDTQFDRIFQEAQSLPHMIDALAEDELEALAASAGRRRGAFPLPHSLAAGVLLAVLGALYAGQGSGFSSGENAREREQAGDTVVLSIDTASLAAAASPEPAPAVAAESPVEITRPENPAAAGDAPAAIALSPEAVEQPAPRDVAASAGPPPAITADEIPVPHVAQAGAPPRELSPLERQQSRLEALPAEHYFLQLMGTFSEQSAQEFIASNGSGDNYYYFRSEYQNRPWYVVVYGSFASRQQAAGALEKLPAALRKTSPWVRSGEEIRLAMAQQ